MRPDVLCSSRLPLHKWDIMRIAVLTQAFGWVGGKSQGDKKWDCFSSCSSCWTNGWGGGVAGAIPSSRDALTWPLQLAVGKQSGVFSTQSEEPTAKPLLVPPSCLASWGDDGNSERNQKRRGLATCQPKEGHVGQEAKNIMTDKQVLSVLSNNEHPKNSHTCTQVCPAPAVQSAHHCRWIPAQKIPAQLGS